MLEVEKYYTEKDMMKLDMELEFIPLTYDAIFKGVFKKNLDILKLFILSQLELDISPDRCKIELFDSELPKDNKKEYQKTVDIFVKVDNMYVNIEINREYFKDVEKRNLIFADKLHSMMLERGEDARKINEKIFVQINLNAVDKYGDDKEKLKYGTDKIVTYGLFSKKIYNSNKYILLKFLEYYRDLYYNGEELDKSSLWLVLFTSRTFQELYVLSKELLDEDLQDQFIRKVIEMNRDIHIFSSWELEKLNELVEVTKHDNAIKDGLEEGIKQGIKQGIEQGIEQGIDKATEEHIMNMLKENLDVDMIARITNKTSEEIVAIKDLM